MHRVAVFAGLGSQSLFSDTTLERAVQDASLPESQILLRACHTAFRTQIIKAIERGDLPAENIDLDDFSNPETLLRPIPKYHQNVLIQHTTIFLVQILRYFHNGWDASKLRGSAGFCVGLLPAATIAAARNEIELLQRAQDFFQIALWLGIYCEAFRKSQIARGECPPWLPWSIVVDNVSSEKLNLGDGDKNSSAPIYISAKNSPTCVTLSGRGDHLAQFVSEKLPPQFRTRATNVLTLYHNRDMLQDVSQKLMALLETEMSAQMGSTITLVAPLFSSVTGIPITFSKKPFKELIVLLLEMILQEPVDWAAVQDSILASLDQDVTRGPCEILNYGPGYGMSRSAGPLPKFVDIRDVSAAGAARDTSGVSKISLNDVAIVGMAVQLPDADNADELWENLCNGKNSCKEIPASRFHIDDFYQRKDSDGTKSRRSINTRYGNFLKNPFLFDNDLFNLSPREAKSMDPQQRVLLQTSYRALEDAGYVPDSTPSNAKKTFGCFIGNATLDYVENLRADIDVYYSPGTLRAFQSGRISYYFGWSGPSITLDTACSSSMVGLYQGARALSAGDCRAALVGGANVISSPDMYLGLDRAHFLSPTGQCKPFDISADGYCRSEGCGIFIIKKVQDALADGDRIHGIVKGIEANQSGNAHSITHPHAPTQQELFGQLLGKAKIQPNQISVVETHGTGTQAGDPNEIESLRGALCANRDARNPIHFTSIKANIGHCEAASGAAALAKVILMMRHNKIPPQISLKKLNPKIKDLGVDGAVIDPTGARWDPSNDQPRLALINNFGAAGSNAAMILRDYDEPAATTLPNPEWRTYMLGISGKSSKVVSKLRDDLVATLKSSKFTESALADVCYTMTARRQVYNHRISVVGDSIDQLAENLRKAAPSEAAIEAKSQYRTVLVFSGQGSQYLGMGQQLMSVYPVFSQAVHKIDNLLKKNGFPGCLDVIKSTSSEGSNPEDTDQLQSFQTAIFALQIGLAQLLSSWNVKASAVIGHSLGEYAALVIAGVLDVASGALLVARRAQLMMTKCKLQHTSMLAVNLSASDARMILQGEDRFKKLDISCDNSPGDCVVGGSIELLKDLKKHLTSIGGVKSKLLEVPMAYHTQALDPILSGLRQFASSLVINKPSIQVISNVLGRTVQPGENVFNAEYFVRHSRESVAFRQGLDDYLSSSPDSITTYWVEVGPHASVLPMVTAQARSPQSVLLPCIRKGTSPSVTLSQLMSQFYQRGLPVNWRKAFAFQEQPRLISLPGLPFNQNEFVAEYPHETSELFTGKAGDSSAPSSSDVFLDRTVQKASNANNFTGIYETSIHSLKDYITGHIVCENALCPASVYHQMALSGIQDMDPDSTSDSVWSLSNIEYVGPLLYTSQSSALVRISISPCAGSRTEFQFIVSSYSEGSQPNRSTVHCKGYLKRKEKKHAEQKQNRTARMLERQITRLQNPEPNTILETFSTKAMYDNVFTRVVTYSELYQRVQFIRISPDYGESYARCKYLGGSSTTSFAANAVFMDVLLHVAGFVANLSLANGEAGICKEVSSALVLREPAAKGAPFDVYCTLTNDAAEGCIVADAQASDDKGVLASFKGMVFQRVQLAKISQAFSIASRRGSTVPSSAQSRMNSVSHASHTATATPKINDVPALEPSRSSANMNIRNLIAQTCGANPSTLSSSATLEDLGFDSLLRIELEAQLASSYPQVDISCLEEHATVGDIEKLLGGQQALETPPSPGEQTPQIPGDDTPDVAGSNNSMLDVQRLTRAIISKSCGADTSIIDSSSELAALGIDSLMIYELESGLLDITKGGNLSTADLSECRTVGDVEKLIIGQQEEQHEYEPAPHVKRRARSPSPVSVTHSTSSIESYTLPPKPTPTLSFPASTLGQVSRMLHLNKQPEQITAPPPSSTSNGSSQPPALFLVHDGSGICMHYHRLKNLSRAVYALHDPQFLSMTTDSRWSSLGEMAETYTATIERTCPGPYLVGGWSFGGVVAFEIARRLIARGHAVVGTILIDSPPPLNHQPLSARIIEAVTAGQEASGASAAKAPVSEPAKAIRALTQRSFTTCADLLAKHEVVGSSSSSGGGGLGTDSAPAPRVLLLRSRAGWSHPADPPGHVENAWLQDRSDPRLATDGWDVVTGTKVPWFDIPGNHFQVFDSANVEEVSAAVRRAAAELEAVFQAREMQSQV